MFYNQKALNNGVEIFKWNQIIIYNDWSVFVYCSQKNGWTQLNKLCVSRSSSGSLNMLASASVKGDVSLSWLAGPGSNHAWFASLPPLASVGKVHVNKGPPASLKSRSPLLLIVLLGSNICHGCSIMLTYLQIQHKSSRFSIWKFLTGEEGMWTTAVFKRFRFLLIDWYLGLPKSVAISS